MHELDEPFDRRLRRGLRSLAATHTAPSSASVLEAALRTRRRRRRRPALLSAAVALVVALLGAVAVLTLNGEDTSSVVTEGPGSVPGMVATGLPVGWEQTWVEHLPWSGEDWRDSEERTIVLADASTLDARRVVTVHIATTSEDDEPRSGTVTRSGDRELTVAELDDWTEVSFQDPESARRVVVSSASEPSSTLVDLAGTFDVRTMTLGDPIDGMAVVYDGPTPPLQRREPVGHVGVYYSHAGVDARSPGGPADGSGFGVDVVPGPGEGLIGLAARIPFERRQVVEIGERRVLVETLGASSWTAHWQERPDLWVRAWGTNLPREGFLTLLGSLRMVSPTEWWEVANRAGATPPYGPTGSEVEIRRGTAPDGRAWAVVVREHRSPVGGARDQACLLIETAEVEDSCLTHARGPDPVDLPEVGEAGGVRIAYGHARGDVATVEVRLTDETTRSVVTQQGIAAPQDRWYAIELPEGTAVQQIQALDSEGNALGRVTDGTA